MRKSRLATTALAALGLCAGVLPASAQSTVDVSVDNTAAARTLYVESMAGLPLESLDFGSVRSLPFRVRVADSSFGRTPFTVSATMTNLYLDESGLDHGTKIPAQNVSLGSQAKPLNVLGVSAAVQPSVTTVTTLADATICNLLRGTVGLTTCALSSGELVGKVQNVEVPVDLSALDNLPLVPQANEVGTFDRAEFGAGTAGAGDSAGKAAAGTEPATPRRVISGVPVDTDAVLGQLSQAIADSPLDALVPTESVTAALQSQFSATWALLTPAQIETILANTVGTPLPLSAAQVLSQTGTYISLPTLNVDVPEGIPAGAYKGTLVVTALQ